MVAASHGEPPPGKILIRYSHGHHVRYSHGEPPRQALCRERCARLTGPLEHFDHGTRLYLVDKASGGGGGREDSSPRSRLLCARAWRYLAGDKRGREERGGPFDEGSASMGGEPPPGRHQVAPEEDLDCARDAQHYAGPIPGARAVAEDEGLLGPRTAVPSQRKFSEVNRRFSGGEGPKGSFKGSFTEVERSHMSAGPMFLSGAWLDTKLDEVAASAADATTAPAHRSSPPSAGESSFRSASPPASPSSPRPSRRRTSVDPDDDDFAFDGMQPRSAHHRSLSMMGPSFDHKKRRAWATSRGPSSLNGPRSSLHGGGGSVSANDLHLNTLEEGHEDDDLHAHASVRGHVSRTDSTDDSHDDDSSASFYGGADNDGGPLGADDDTDNSDYESNGN